MADKLPFLAAESGTWRTTTPTPHIDLSGSALSLGTYPVQTFAAAAADTTLDFASTNRCTIVAWVDASNWVRYEGAVWTDATPDTLDLSAATLMGAAGTISASATVSVVATLPSPVNSYAMTFASALWVAPASATTYYYGNSPLTPSINPNRYKMYIPKSGTLKVVDIFSFSGTAGTGEEWETWVRLNNTTNTSISTVSSATAERRWVNTALSVDVVIGDYIEFTCLTPTWSTAPANIRISGVVLIES